MVMVCIEAPSTSESRMNSCRRSSVMCPASVRKEMAVAHSSSVSLTSRRKACRCRVRDCSTNLVRGSSACANEATTRSVSSCSRSRCSFVTRQVSLPPCSAPIPSLLVETVAAASLSHR
jgi:hypothetical protein